MLLKKVDSSSNFTFLGVPDSPEQEKERSIILMAALKASDVKKDCLSFFPARDNLLLSRKIISYSLIGAAGGAGIGFVAGGPTGAAIGAGLGGLGGCVTAIVVFKAYAPKRYEVWRSKQTEETLLKFAKLIPETELPTYNCELSKKLMLKPTRGTCGHVYDFDAFHKAIDDSSYYDAKRKTKVGICPGISSDDLFHYEKPSDKCRLSHEDLRVDYSVLGQMVAICKEKVKQIVPTDEGLTKPEEEGLRQLNEDMRVLANFCYKTETEQTQRMLDKGEIDPQQAGARAHYLGLILSGVKVKV